MLILSRKTNEKIIIGNDITVSIIEVRGDQVKIGVEAPRTVKVYRQEIYQAIQSENKEAVISVNSDSQLNALSNLIQKEK